MQLLEFIRNANSSPFYSYNSDLSTLILWKWTEYFTRVTFVGLSCRAQFTAQPTCRVISYSASLLCGKSIGSTVLREQFNRGSSTVPYVTWKSSWIVNKEEFGYVSSHYHWRALVKPHNDRLLYPDCESIFTSDTAIRHVNHELKCKATTTCHTKERFTKLLK
jgi:hypothetical protein